MRKILALAFVFAFVAAPALAFHDAGVAHCNGCHTMHNSQDGAPVDPDSPNGNLYLLNDATPSDTCLGCHALGLGAVLAADPLAPSPQKGAGNFVFLTEDNINDGHDGALHPITGEHAGHNIDAPGNGLAPSTVHTTAPGGAFLASQMGCTSCHDPHGNDNFRMLYGAGRVVQGSLFPNPAPTADGISIFFGSESNTNHTAYQGGMSAWCGNCHGLFHNSGANRHPSGETFSGDTVTTYETYNGTAAYNSGTAASSYLSQVPFEEPTMDTAWAAGPTNNSEVSCITCHRAHATSGPDAGRWDFNITLWSEEGVESGSYVIPNPYADPFQRSLCNKCHNKDEFDAHSAP